MQVDYSSPIEERYKKRINLLENLKTTRARAIALELCKKDPIWWINNFAVTYDPRVKPSLLPFFLYPRQAEYLLWRRERRRYKHNGVTEKSRDTGVSYLNCASQLHYWLFEDGYKGAFGSNKEIKVDRIGDPDSLFEKLRIILQNLPNWMLPTGFDFDKHDNFCKLINPANGSTITGEAGDNIGRGGRSTIYDVDEAAFLEHPEKAERALSNNSDCIFYTSSANGTNFFYQKRMQYPPEWVFTLFWRDDPRKDDDWYQQMCVKYDEITVASEIDINYFASVEGIFIPAHWVRSAVKIQIPARGIRKAGLDVAYTGKNFNVFTPRIGNVIRPQTVWKESNTTVTAYKARDLMIEYELEHMNLDGDGAGAGVASTYALIKKLPFSYTAIRSGGSPSDREWEGENRTSKDKFANKRAELWGMVRERFRKTFNHVQGIAKYKVDELISIPDDATLINQLSSPLAKMTSTGKILVESKEEMAKRGVPSPDSADSLIYSEEYPGYGYKWY